jgi:hypothetical protein
MTKACRCADCGFLSYRNPETRSLDGADLEARREGLFPSFYTRTPVEHGIVTGGPTTAPCCFAMAFDLDKEVRSVREAMPPNRRDLPTIFLAVINEPRDCPAWCAWHPGFTPKEHREMLVHIDARKLELEYRERREEAEARRRVAEKKADRLWQVAMLAVGAALATLFRFLAP